MRAQVTLRYIVWPADFRRSDMTLYREVPEDIRNKLKSNDAICFVSGIGNQILFVYRAIKVGRVVPTNTAYDSYDRELFSSVRLRLNAGYFNPEMLANYAGEIGLELVGLKRFEEKHRKLVA